jgi:hypothetical protein
MNRALCILALATLVSLAGARAEWKPTVLVRGKHYCAEHHRPLVSVRGFQSSSNPLTLVHSADPRSAVCGERAPNRIGDDQRLIRSKIHIEPHIVTYCPQCAAAYWQCMGRDQQLSDSDIQQMISLVSRRPDFRKPVIRIVPMYEGYVLVIGGHEKRVGDVFSDLGVAKRRGKWIVAYPVNLYRVIALRRQ